MSFEAHIKLARRDNLLVMFFDSWQSLLTILTSAVFSYVVIIIWLRIFGKRTLSKWNAFDFIVTIALGSVLATMIMSKDVKLLDGVLAIFLLIFLQFIITFISARSEWFDKLVKAEPKFLYLDGEFLKENMKTERVPKPEILAAIRTSGVSALEDVKAVVLETDGSFSVIEKSGSESDSALSDVKGGKN